MHAHPNQERDEGDRSGRAYQGVGTPRWCGGVQAVGSHDITRVLSRLFLLMAHGPHAWVDTEPLVSTLALSPAIQQDGSEFFKLLLTKVETLLAPSKVRQGGQSSPGSVRTLNTPLGCKPWLE